MSLLPIDGLSPTATDTPYQPSSDTSKDAADRAKAFAHRLEIDPLTDAGCDGPIVARWKD